MARRELSDLMADVYSIEMVQRDGIHFLLIPDLGLTASGPDLARALNDLEARKTEYFATQIALGREDQVRSRRGAGSAAARSLMPFLIKSAVVALVGSFVVGVGIVAVEYTFRESVRKAVLRATHAGFTEFTSSLEALADADINPNRDERIRKALREAVRKLKPYVAELRPLFEEAAAVPQVRQ